MLLVYCLKYALAVFYYYSRNTRVLKSKLHYSNNGCAAPLDRACHVINNLLNINLFYDFLPSTMRKLCFPFYIVLLIVFLSYLALFKKKKILLF